MRILKEIYIYIYDLMIIFYKYTRGRLLLDEKKEVGTTWKCRVGGMISVV